ncbi:hypothetical protein RRG08_059913 [Elysia crispata]|uniref:Uncharacterized protein n=1 Tax=Elysia crispata TaxID=231223 RepID=A0AAE0Y6K0_9GAST|nr:hypothetical protein RRG08_059913 [Elysia crispata]
MESAVEGAGEYRPIPRFEDTDKRETARKATQKKTEAAISFLLGKKLGHRSGDSLSRYHGNGCEMFKTAFFPHVRLTVGGKRNTSTHRRNFLSQQGGLWMLKDYETSKPCSSPHKRCAAATIADVRLYRRCSDEALQQQ